ncbi:MAG: YybH family protein [Candidatus Binatia bacterium]
MKNFAYAGVLLVGLLCAAVGEAAPKKLTGSPPSDLINEAAIRKTYRDFTAAWNRHDVAAMANMWAVDGDDLEPDGRLAKGRTEVEKLLRAEHATVFKNSHLTLDIDTVWFIANNVALVDGEYSVTGVQDPQGKALAPRKGHLSAIFLKERSKWWIAASRLMIPAPLPWRKK